MQNIKAKIPPLERQDFRFGGAGGILPRAHKQSTGLFVTAVAVALFESHPHKYHAKKPKERENAFFRFLAERVGFEPTVPLLVHLISSQGRYNHFDTAPYSVDWLVCIIAGCPGKIKDEFVAQQVQCRASLRAGLVPFMGLPGRRER